MIKIKFISTLLIAALILNACETDYLTPKVVEITTPVSFSNDIIPIFTTECAIPTCHVNGGAPPNLTADKAYDELMGLGYVDTSNAEQSLLYVRITATVNPMPPSGKLSAEETGYILAWIEQGAQNN
jgi:hypothetical protein